MKPCWTQRCFAYCLVAGVLGIGYLKYKTIPFFGDYILKIALGVAIICFILVLNVKVKFGNRVSAFLGSISYEVYLIHGIAFGLVSWMLPDSESGVFIAFSIIVTVVLSVVHWLGKIILRRG